MPGLGKKTFTAGDVLIAGDVNNYLMDQTVMNFATVAARSSAIPVPSTGMVSYVGDTGSETPTSNIPQIQAYTGAAWESVYGLTLLAKTTATSGDSVVFTNVFDDTYDFYQITINNLRATNAQSIGLRLGAANTNYYWAEATGPTYPTASGAVNASNGNATTFFTTGIVCGTTTTETGSGTMFLDNPFLSINTNYHCLGVDPRSGGAGPRVVSGVQQSTTSFTGFTILSTNGTFNSINVRVYGVRK